MPTARKKDEFSQIAYMTVTETALNTLTFQGMSVFSNILTPKGMVIHRIEYECPVANQALIAASNDYLTFGIAGDDTLTAIVLSDAKVYDYQTVALREVGTPASAFLFSTMHIIDFTQLPGGGRLVPADRVYMFVEGVSLTGPATVSARLHFTLKDLAPQQYIELAQALRVLT